MQMSRIQFRFKNSQRQNNAFEEFFGPQKHWSRSETRALGRDVARVQANQRYKNYVEGVNERNKEYGHLFGNQTPQSRQAWDADDKQIQAMKRQQR